MYWSWQPPDKWTVGHGIRLNRARISAMTIDAYNQSLARFDSAVCEAIAVSQATSGQRQAPNIAYATYVFTRMCGAGVCIMRAAPLSRWVASDFEDWQFAAVAGHARSILDGFLLFSYLIEPPVSDDELSARINVMHLNDCVRRIELFENLGDDNDIAGFHEQRSELRERLASNKFFSGLPASVQKNCLNGKFLMIHDRDTMLAKTGIQKAQFDALYILWSQHLHIFPLSFSRLEPNGRGTGLLNDTDMTYIASALDVCAGVLGAVTDQLVELFPYVAEVRKGVNSTFVPGPESNKPRRKAD